MARKKKGKSIKNSTSSVLSGKSAGQPQRVIAPHAKNGRAGHDKKTPQVKSGTNPAKSPDKTGSNQPEQSVTRKQKQMTTNTSGNAGIKSNTSSTSLTAISAPPLFLKFSNFLTGVLAEFRKISWPQRSQVAQETFTVLFLVLLITGLVWGFDQVIGKLVFSPLEHLGHLYGIGAKH